MLAANPVKLLEKLGNVKLFEGLNNKLIKELLEIGTYSHIIRGEYIFFQGEPAENVYLLIEGQVKLALTNGKGDQITVQHIGPKETFALIGALKKSNYPVTAQAFADGQILSWDANQFKSLFAKHSDLASNSTRIISERSINFQSRILELSTEKVERRIAHALLRLAHQLGRKGIGGVIIDLNLTRQDIAELSGTTLFSASRMLSKWENDGIVKCSKDRVQITDAHKLVDIAEDLPSKYISLID